MKTFLTLSLAVFATFSSHAEEPDPFAETHPEQPRPEREIKKLPKSVTYKRGDQGSHVYEVSGIYNARMKRDDYDLDNSIYSAFVPDCTNFKLNFENHSCLFSVSRKLTFSELAYALDDMAEMGGELPYWCELEARDILPSALVGHLEYSTSTVTIDEPLVLAWFWTPKDKPLRIPLSFGGPDLGTLLIIPSTAHCMSHSRYVLRILDGKGLLIWTDEKTLFAGVKIATSDVDKDSIHEIWIYRDDHGKKEKFQIRGSFK